MAEQSFKAEGQCACGAVRYRLQRRPMFVNCCHCSWCQRETGGAFVINAIIETEAVELLKGKPQSVPTPSASGRGQVIVRCPKCRVAVWSHYAGGGQNMSFVRAGTLDDPSLLRPDAHVYTATQLAWVQVSDEAPRFREYYDSKTLWSEESLQRARALRQH